ncbi:hypothetical protein TNCV_3358501 [Trichonephila clavipes]|nr:hypothetical protein TNCV_3358501 [Trichonephila clavipes]
MIVIVFFQLSRYGIFQDDNTRINVVGLVTAEFWLEGGQMSACHQLIWDLGTLNQHLKLWPEEQFPKTTGALSC